MKRLITIFFISIVTVLSFTGCKDNNDKTNTIERNEKKVYIETEEEKAHRIDSLNKVKLYIKNESTEGTLSVDENIENSYGSISVDNNTLSYRFDVKDPSKTDDWVSAQWMLTEESLTDRKEEDPEHQTIYSCMLDIRGGAESHQIMYYINPYNVTSDSLPDSYNYFNDGKVSEENIPEETLKTFSDIFNLSLEALANNLSKNNVGIELKDLGFTNYVIDTERVSVLGSSRLEEPDPAPISVEVISFEHNSAKAPELYAVFTNTGDTTIEAFDFVVRCYDSYGDVIKEHGFGDELYGARLPEPLAPGESSSPDLYWTMNGFQDTRSVEIAIIKYKLEGCDPVEISPKYAVWH